MNRQQIRGMWRSRLAGPGRNGSNPTGVNQTGNKQVINLHINKLVVDGIPRDQTRTLGQDVKHGLHGLLQNGDHDLFLGNAEIDGLHGPSLTSSGNESLGNRVAKSVFASLLKQSR